MKYELEELVKAINKKLLLFEEIDSSFIDHDFINKTSLWSPADLFSRIFKSSRAPQFLDENGLSALKNEFEATFPEVAVNLAYLKQRHWIRIIMEMVELPTTISFATTVFEKHVDSLPELRFLKWVILKGQSSMSMEQFNAYTDQYNTENGITLDTTKDGLDQFITKANDQIKLASLMYFDSFIKYENDFRFIHFLKHRMHHGNQPKVSIHRKLLLDLISEHRTSYSSTPIYQEFVNEGVFIEAPTEVIVNAASYWEYFGDDINPSIFNHYRRQSEQDYWQNWLAFNLSQGWTNDLQLALPEETRTQILASLYEQLISDNDFAPLEQEIDKARLDCERDVLRVDSANFNNPAYFLEKTDSFYERLHKIDRIAFNAHSNLLTIQESRNNAAHALTLLLMNDGFYEDDPYYYSKRLIEKGIERPYLLYETCDIILHRRKEIIPFLLADPSYCTLALYLISNLEIHFTRAETKSVENEKVFLDLWLKASELYGKVLADEIRPRPERFSVMVFETLKLIFRGRYYSSHGPAYAQTVKRSPEFMVPIASISRIILGHQDPSLILNSVHEQLLTKNKEKNTGDIITLPLVTLHLSLQILQWSTLSGKSDSLTATVLAHLKKSFSDIFQGHDCFEKGTSIWGNQKYLHLFPWHELILAFHHHHQLHGLMKLSPFRFPEPLRIKPLEHIRMTATIRAQSSRAYNFREILSIGLRELSKDKPNAGVSAEIEKLYQDFITRFSVDDISHGLLNIFSEDLLYHNQYDKPRILPEIAFDLNLFQNRGVRTEIVSLLATRLTFSQLVELRHYLTGEGDRELLKEAFQNLGLQSLLDADYYHSDLGLTLRMLAWEKILEEEIQGFLTNETFQTNQYATLNFTLRLYEAFHRKDINMVRSVTIPENKQHGLTASDYGREKYLFEALILSNKKEYLAARKMLEDLLSQKSVPVYVLNLFINMIGVASSIIKNEEQKAEIERALAFWNTEKVKFTSLEWSGLQNSAWYYELFAYEKIKDDENFESLYRGITLPGKMEHDILLIRIQNLIRQGRDFEANELHRLARTYHFQNDRSNYVFFEQLDKEISSPSYLSRLENYYLQILDRQPNDFIKIVPDRINPKKEQLLEFLGFEMEWCLKEVIKRVRSLSDIVNETKYNDLFTSMLEARISGYGWSVKDNSTGNKSERGTDPGERDLIVQWGNREIAVIECLHIYDRPNDFIKSHIKKVFDYSAEIIPRYIVAYYRGPSPKFQEHWTKYREVLFPATTFGSLYAPTPPGIQELESGSDGVFKGKSVHGNFHELYHLCVNLNFMN